MIQATELHKWEVVFEYNGLLKIYRLSSLKIVLKETGVQINESMARNNIDATSVAVISGETLKDATVEASVEGEEGIRPDNKL